MCTAVNGSNCVINTELIVLTLSLKAGFVSLSVWTIIIWCAWENLVIEVVAIDVPIAAPTFLNKFWTPDALVCSSFDRVAQDIFDKVTIDNTIPAPNTKLGKIISDKEIFVLICPNNNPPAANVIKPIIAVGLIPSLTTSIPLNIEAIKHPAPLGIMDNPLKKAVYPSSLWSIEGRIAADDINIAIKIICAPVPIIKFLFLKIERFINPSPVFAFFLWM